MVLLGFAGLVILGFFLLSIFDRELRDKVVDLLRANLDNLLKKLPVLVDAVVIDPLTEQTNKFLSGRETGGIQLDVSDRQRV